MTNPLNTLTGRMVLVTIAAVLLSYGAAFAIYANERGAALRRAAESAVVERVVYMVEQLQAEVHEGRVLAPEQGRNYGLRYDIATSPAVAQSDGVGAGARIAHALTERLGATEVHAQTRVVKGPRRGGGRRDGPPEDGFGDGGGPPGPPGDPPNVQRTVATVSVRLDEHHWLNARERLPGPRPAPLSALAAAIVAVVVVGVGAALVSRQIGRPLADLADAARALGAGQANVTAPISGPDDVRRASTAFNAMAERLGRQLSRQRQMLWALSHDLRTPITAIRLRAELVDDEATRQRLLASVEEMERLTEEALSLARAGASEEARTEVDLAEIARTLCGELQDMGVQATADAHAPVLVTCRPSEVARAMRNLAENAAKYGGGGVMRVYRDGADAVVEVADEGPGVPDAVLATLAAPFFRADEARSTTSGAGLGLAIAQAIAEAHGGRLVLANRAPRGFSAKLVLPG